MKVMHGVCEICQTNWAESTTAETEKSTRAKIAIASGMGMNANTWTHVVTPTHVVSYPKRSVPTVPVVSIASYARPAPLVVWPTTLAI